MKDFRDRILLSSKFPAEVAKKPGDYRRQLETTLSRLGTDYLDFYHFWGINRDCFDNVIMAQDLLNDVQKAKDYGLTEHAQKMFDEYVEKGGKLRESCINCGYCERKCPQHLQIRQELDKVEALFRDIRK